LHQLRAKDTRWVIVTIQENEYRPGRASVISCTLDGELNPTWLNQSRAGISVRLVNLYMTFVHLKQKPTK